VKRLPDLIDAVGRLGGLVHLHVFGDGRERPAIERQIAALGVERCVTLHGACARPQDALARIGLLVLPSEAEGFGLVLIEAMAAGRPGGRDESAGDPRRGDRRHNRHPGLPTQPHSLASAVRAMVQKPWLRERIAARAKVEVERRYAWPAVLTQYRQLLGLS
jgi:glycosyltransferase involved in cell wall biosynthesis